MAKHNFRRSLASSFVVLALALSFAGALGISHSARAQEPSTAGTTPTQDVNRIELHQALLDLTNPWTVMCIAAHPDDEDGTSLIVMRRKYGAHTVSLFSTFGEGGQNAIGPELYEELGAIRARETMAAAEVQGSEPYFLGLKDFGYSKSADEAFRIWGHEEALRRMVLQIRRLHPDVIITNHSVTNNDHGHHQATARLELEAFDAAADPKRFPEQMKEGLTAWQVQRLFVRAGRSNQAQVEGAPLVTIDPNELDPTRGKIYAAEALQALQKHATQGPWPKTVAQMAARFTNSSDGRLPLIRYRLTREGPNVPPIPSQPQTLLDGLQMRLPIETWLDMLKIKPPLGDFLNERDRLFEHLLAANEKPPKISDNDIAGQAKWSLLKTRLNRALLLSSGITIDVSSTIATPNSGHTVSFNFENTSARAVTLTRAGGEPVRLLPKSSTTVRKDVRIPSDWSINLPLYKHLYDGFTSGLIVKEYFRVAVEGHSSFAVSPSIELDVAPAVEIAEITPSPVVLTPPSFERTGVKTYAVRPTVFSITLVNHQSSPFNGNLSATSSEGEDKPHNLIVKLAAGENKTFTMVVSPPAVGSLTFTVGNGTVSSPPQQVPVVTTVASVAPGLRVGYVRGFDYSLPNALNTLGVESKELTVDEVKTADLQKYSTIIVDNRVYESQPGLIAANQKLLDYAKEGGTLIVFYHKSFEWNPDERRNRPQLAPYKLILGDERVTDETAPITFSEPEHPLLNVPNRIGQEDFANWIQERGLYYPKDWDPQFHALLQSNDPGEAPLKGGLLVADYGRGHYIYTSMVWYRELRAGVPGAYRMFANMISYGHK